ncbi:hypothetical protein chiPu_0017869 [Chiloscyllium punctatum]|uniref:Uncharacterized protein n=1 Tax=Chiloscyllium punctatum TaxID=137246 RepID=A0A401RJG0_CHIPU|nr:hypothetical protein [Chiloscyllium punctatum]
MQISEIELTLEWDKWKWVCLARYFVTSCIRKWKREIPLCVPHFAERCVGVNGAECSLIPAGTGFPSGMFSQEGSFPRTGAGKRAAVAMGIRRRCVRSGWSRELAPTFRHRRPLQPPASFLSELADLIQFATSIFQEAENRAASLQRKVQTLRKKFPGSCRRPVAIRPLPSAVCTGPGKVLGSSPSVPAPYSRALRAQEPPDSGHFQATPCISKSPSSESESSPA